MDQNHLQVRANKLRRNLTHAEQIMWRILRARQLNHFKFRRQYIIPPYIVDFVCVFKKLIIELDGEHHEDQQHYDEVRTKYLELKGYKLMRFKNDRVFNHADDVLMEISKALES